MYSQECWVKCERSLDDVKWSRYVVNKLKGVECHFGESYPKSFYLNLKGKFHKKVTYLHKIPNLGNLFCFHLLKGLHFLKFLKKGNIVNC